MTSINEIYKEVSYCIPNLDCVYKVVLPRKMCADLLILFIQFFMVCMTWDELIIKL